MNLVRFPGYSRRMGLETYRVVIRELDGAPVTSMVISDQSIAARIADGSWR